VVQRRGGRKGVRAAGARPQRRDRQRMRRPGVQRRRGAAQTSAAQLVHHSTNNDHKNNDKNEAFQDAVPRRCQQGRKSVGSKLSPMCSLDSKGVSSKLAPELFREAPVGRQLCVQRLQQQPGVRQRILPAAQQQPPAVGKRQRGDGLQHVHAPAVSRRHEGRAAQADTGSGSSYMLMRSRMQTSFQHPSTHASATSIVQPAVRSIGGVSALQ
jgi:hypothetical protein